MAPQSQVTVRFLIPLAINSSFMYRLRFYIDERPAIDGFMVVFDLMRRGGKLCATFTLTHCPQPRVFSTTIPGKNPFLS